MPLTNVLKKLHKKVTGLDITKGNVTDILTSMEENYAAQPGGGSEPTYETVAEIEVGTMESKEGFLRWAGTDSVPVADSDILFFNSADKPLTFHSESGAWYYNMTADGEILGEPAYIIRFGDDSVSIIADAASDLSNTTVRILKKVEQGGGGDSSDSGKFVVDLTYDYVSDEKVWSATHNGEPISIADIYDEIVDGKNVVCCTDQIDAMPTDGIPVTVYMEEQGVYFISFSYMTTSMVGEFGGISIFATHEESDVWSVGDGKLVTDEALENLKPTYEFDFSAELGDGSFTATPASGVTYAAIASALAETPHVFAKITFPSAMGLVVYARFNESVTGDGQTVYYANGLVILGGNPTAIGLNIGDNAGQPVCVGTVKTLAVAT